VAHTETINKILEQVRGTDTVAVIEPAKVGQTSKKNELLMFVKPEVFMVDNLDHARASLEMIFSKLDQFGAEVDGVIIVGGKALEDKEIMNRHYGFINLMSRKASQVMSAEDRAKIEELLGVSLDEYKPYGGNEFLASHPNYNAHSLDALWSTKKSKRVRGGFYVADYEADGEKFVLVNAFHPVQLLHFTEPSHRIVLLLIHSDNEWSTLRGDLIGTTNPENASPESIRGALFAEPAKYGFEKVGSGNNGVHLSAGPFEGMSEIVNFLGNLFDLDVSAEPPLLLQKLKAAGLSQEQALKATENPTVEVDGKSSDLYGSTEDINSDEAVAFYTSRV
jgi:hypothetical protein